MDLNTPFLTSQLITYIGNKRKLLPFLREGFDMVRNRLGKQRLTILDGFAGSGAVSRLLKYYAESLYVNDIEAYALTLNRSYLANASTIDTTALEQTIEYLNTHRFDSAGQGMIEKLYAPADDMNIKPGERVFYTNKNAHIIDTIRQLIDSDIPPELRPFAVASLLVEASIHTNTSGIFKGFHKKSGIGHFGGSGEHARSRIMQDIELEVPLFSDCETDVHVCKQDINTLVLSKDLPLFDLAYFDPPYNQHPYGSNYFMLNLINDYVPAEIQDGVSGIPKQWQHSAYNSSKHAALALSSLIRDTRARYIVISYNDEGIIPLSEFKRILSSYGPWDLLSRQYATYRGSRNLRNRNTTVQELLWILEKTKTV